MEILYYTKELWGTKREYVLDPGQRQIIKQLTGTACITPVIRELLRDLTDGYIQFHLTNAPL